MKILKCKKCGAMVQVIEDCHCDNCGIMCCGESMVELKPNTENAAQEKHVPACEIQDGTVEVSIGEVIHPMEEDHYIEFVIAEYKDSMLKYDFKPGMDPLCYFDYEKGMKVYSYCNKHGLWMKEL